MSRLHFSLKNLFKNTYIYYLCSRRFGIYCQILFNSSFARTRRWLLSFLRFLSIFLQLFNSSDRGVPSSTSLSLCDHDNIGSDFHITLDNMKFFKWIVFNHIEKWNLMEIIKIVLPCERKSSALEKNGIWTNFIFQKLSAQDLGGWTLCVISQKWCYFWKCCLLQWEKDVFQNLTFAKKTSKSALEMQKLP